MLRTSTRLLGLLAVMLMTATASAASLDEFVKSIADNGDLSDDARQDVLTLIDDLKAEELPDGDIVSEALLLLYPTFDDAMAALGEEDTDSALAELEKLAAGEDKYLAAEATYYIGRAHMMNEDYEEALPAMSDVLEKHAEHTVRPGEALFFKGMCHVHLLDRKNAIEALDEFILEYDEAPERMQMAAWHHLETLKAIEDGTLSDVQARMDYSRRRLALERAGDRTQEEQENIIAMLDKLIEEAEQREQQGGT